MRHRMQLYKHPRQVYNSRPVSADHAKLSLPSGLIDPYWLRLCLLRIAA
jgi:hypothetical protein